MKANVCGKIHTTAKHEISHTKQTLSEVRDQADLVTSTLLSFMLPTVLGGEGGPEVRTRLSPGPIFGPSFRPATCLTAAQSPCAEDLAGTQEGQQALL